MADDVLEMLGRYLARDMDFDALERRVIQLAPNAEGESRILLDSIAAEIFYVWDGVSDEALFRERAAAICAPVNRDEREAGPTPSAA